MVEVILIGDYHQYTPEDTEVGLKAIATVDKSPENGNATVVDASGSSEADAGGSSENGSHSNKSEGILKLNGEPTARFDGNTYKENVEAGESSGVAGELVEEEIVEFEFKKAKSTLATYSMHCPSCKAEVVLRRQVITLRPPEPPVEPQPAQVITIEPHGDGAAGPLDIDRYISSFRLLTGSSSSDDEISDVLKFDGEPTTYFDRNTYKKNVEAGESSEVAGEVVAEEIGEFEFKKANPTQATYSMHCPNCKAEVSIAVLRRKVITLRPPEPPVEPQPPILTSGTPDLDEYISSLRLFTMDHPGNETRIDVTMGEFRVGGRRGILAEILKSIIYGSLMEVIASLSVVAFAAASDTSTLNLIALALASLIGGIIVIWHNVWDLRNDCYRRDTNEEAEGAINKYKEIFGRINYFPLHAFCATLFSLILGMVPPVAYGFLFYKTNDREFTMLKVVIVSLLCVGLLSIFKAFFNNRGASKYFKTIVYYIISTILASGISYVAGKLVTRLVKELGLFDMRSDGGGMSLLPHDTTSYLASF